jgi:hypothetical protein
MHAVCRRQSSSAECAASATDAAKPSAATTAAAAESFAATKSATPSSEATTESPSTPFAETISACTTATSAAAVAASAVRAASVQRVERSAGVFDAGIQHDVDERRFQRDQFCGAEQHHSRQWLRGDVYGKSAQHGSWQPLFVCAEQSDKLLRFVCK